VSDLYGVAMRGLVEYRQIMLPTGDDVKPASFHYEWSDDLLKGKQHVCYEGYRESGKTSLILRAFPLYALTFPSKQWEYIILIKANQGQARKALKGIVDEYMGNPLINMGNKKVKRKTADVFEVEIVVLGQTYNILIEAYGKGASIRGLNNKDVRPSIIVIDDCQDTADLLGENVPENDWDWFLSDVAFLGKTARIFMIGNNLGERCIVERVSRNAESMNFKFKRIAAANKDLTVSSWAENETIEEILKERDDYIAIGKLDVWLREKMCQSTNEATRIFKDEMYKSYAPSLKDRLADEGEVFAALDPASSKRKDACLRAIVVGVLMKDGHWYILDAPYGRWDTIELMDKMFDVVRKWGIRDFGIEKGQHQQILEPILYREMTLRQIRFNVNELEHGKLGSKLDRVKMMQPHFKSGSVWFPDNAEWLSEMKSELAGVTRYEFKSEFVDVIDALAMLLTQMRDFSSRLARDEKRIGDMQRVAIT
jgi:predicted phage terminase large subunit-like protein